MLRFTDSYYLGYGQVKFTRLQMSANFLRKVMGAYGSLLPRHFNRNTLVTCNFGNVKTLCHNRTSRGVPTNLTCQNLHTRPVAISNGNFNSILGRRKSRLLRVRVNSSSSIHKNTSSHQKKLVQLTYHS